jgi:hypothetical protein
LPKKLEFKIATIQEQISISARNYLFDRRIDHTEPLYRILDRIIGEYKLSEICMISEERDRWKRISEAMLERAIEAERKLKESKQAVLI